MHFSSDGVGMDDLPVTGWEGTLWGRLSGLDGAPASPSSWGFQDWEVDGNQSMC